MFGNGASIECDDCTFEGNMASTVGAVVYVIGGSLSMTDSTVKDNESPIGGNLLIDDSNVVLSGCDFDGNTAIYGDGAAITILNIHSLVNSNFDFDNTSDLIS